MQIITSSQCRAARGLLNWSQPDLAERCEIHVQTISNFEKESSTPSKATLTKILLTFELAGVVFDEDEGVRKKKGIVTRFEGLDAKYVYLDNLYNDLKDKPGTEILISGLAEVKPQDEERKFVEMHVNRLIKAGVTERLLICEGDTNLIAPKEWYRWIPKKFFSSAPFQLYEDKLALHEWGPPQSLILIQNRSVAESYRKLFNFAWEHAKSIP